MPRLVMPLGAFLLSVHVAAAQAPASVEALLAASPTPGTTALLVEHATRADVQAHLARQLSHPAAEVRAAAARVILAVNALDLLPRLSQALQAERSRDAAAELTRAVAILGGPAQDETLVASWARLGPDAAPAAVAFARVRGGAALGALAAVQALPASVVVAFVEAAKPDAAALDRLLEQAVTTAAPVLFRAGLAATEAARLRPAEARLVAGLAPDRPGAMRLEAARALLVSWTGEAPLSAAAVAGLSLDAPFGDDPTSVDAVVLRELAGRAAGRRSSPGTEWRAQVDEPGSLLASLVRSGGVQRLLTSQELRQLRRALPQLARGGQPDLPPVASLAVQLIDSYPRGFVTGVMTATGCDVSKARTQGLGAGAGELVLRRDGRPARISLIDTGVTQAACAHAARVLLMTHAADRPPAGDGERRVTVVPFDAEYLSCHDSQGDLLARGPDVVGAARVTPPKKTRHVDPVYPETAQRSGVQGVVVLDAVIGVEGCVSRLSVNRGVDPRLDLAALLSVMRWRFSPARLDDRPAPVIMTVSVQFSLR